MALSAPIHSSVLWLIPFLPAFGALLNGATGISPEMALRLSKALGTSPEFWYGMQVNFDLWQAKKKFRGKVLPIIQRPITAA